MWFAAVTNLKTGRQFEVGGWTEDELRESLTEIQETGYENLDDCVVDIYTDGGR